MEPADSGQNCSISSSPPNAPKPSWVIPAVCVNPTDERYRHLKGKKVIVPLVNRKVPVIFDEYVDTEFGTGALKVTPAHDINDYNLGLKHDLAVIDTLNEDGTLSAAARYLLGWTVLKPGKKSLEKLKEEGFLIKEEEYQPARLFPANPCGGGTADLHAMVRENEAPGRTGAGSRLLSGEIKIHPGEKFLATYKYWLENVKDWCISRQLWWGQRIPAWYDDKGNFVVAETEEEA